MIIFYNKTTGQITGTIDGRIHGKEHLNMWVGPKDDNARLVIMWAKNKKGFFEPNVQDKSFKNILTELDKKKLNIYDFVIDTDKATLIKKEQNG